MNSVHLVGWRPGLQTVSLIRAIKQYSGGSLKEAMNVVEQLIGGEEVSLTFRNEADMRTFSALAEEYGCVVHRAAEDSS